MKITKPNRRVLVGVLAATALFVSACGGDDDDATDTPPATEGDAPAPTGAPDTSGGSDTTPAAEGEPFKIALGLPTTGPLAPNGSGNKDGFEFYFAQNGSTAGGRPVEISFKDTTGAPDVAVSNAQEAIERDDVDLLAGYVSSAEALAVRDVAARAEVPLVITQAATSKLVAEGEAASQYVTQLIVPLDDMFPVITQRAIDDGHTKLVYMGSDYEAGKDAEAAVRATAEASGAEVVRSIFAPLGTQDFAPFLGNVPSDADAVVVFFGGTDAVRFVQQYQEFGLAGEIPLYAHWALTIEPLLEQMTADAASGIVTAQEYNSALDNPANTAFVEAWTAEFGVAPNAWNAQGYTAAMVIDAALTADPSASGATLAAALHATAVDAPQGPISFSESGQISTPTYIAAVEGTDSGLANVPETAS